MEENTVVTTTGNPLPAENPPAVVPAQPAEVSQTKWGKTILTQQGLALEAKVHAGQIMKFTRVAVGDGQIEDAIELVQMTQLKNYRHSFPIDFVRKDLGKSVATIGAVITNKNIPEGFLMREVGLYAQDPDEGEILYAVRNTGIYAEPFPEASVAEVNLTMELKIFVGNAENVQILIDDNMVYVTKAEFFNLAGAGRTTENVKKNADDIQKLAVEVSVLKNASLNNINTNIFIVNFKDLSVSEEFEGIWNVPMKRLEV